MKIKEVLLKEYQTGNIGKPGNVTQPGKATNAASLKTAQDFAAGNTPAPAGQAAQNKKPAAAPKKKVLAPVDPQVMARQNELIAAGAKIKADGRSGPATTQAEKDFGPKVDAAKGSQTAGTATTITNPAQANQNAQPAPAEPAPVAAEPAAPAPSGAAAALANMGKPTGTPTAPADDLARMTQLAGAGRPGGGYGNFTGGQQQAAPAPDQAAQAATPAPGEFTPVPSGFNTTAPAVTDRSGNQVKTGTGGTLTSRSDDELAWASKQPMGGTGQQYPGAGNWDPRTGRDLKAAAQGEKNWQSIKNFFGGKKPAAAAPAPTPMPSGQAGQPSPGAAGAMAAMRESDDAVLATIRKIR